MKMSDWNWAGISDLKYGDAPRCRVGMFAAVVPSLSTSFISEFAV